MRLTKIEGSDLRLFDFDYDVTWMAFFLNADEHVYGRYGGRDAEGAEHRISLAGLRYTMEAALKAYRADPQAKPERREGKPLYAEELPAAKQLRAGQCIHCHQVYEFQRQARQAAGKWHRDEVWVYPLPENIGITLEIDRGDHVRSVAKDSAADRAGIRAGDILRNLNGVPVASFADAQYALNKAPAQGQIPFAMQRGENIIGVVGIFGRLNLPPGWRETNITWRTSLLDLLPSLSLFGQDLSAEEKKALGLAPKRLAFRQDKHLHPDAKEVGVRENDVIIGINGKKMEMDMLGFLGYIRRNYRVGEKLTLNILRDGKPVELSMMLR